MKKPVANPVPNSGACASIDDLVDKYVLMAEFLTSTAYEGDPPGTRLPSSLLVFGQDGMWKGMLNDRQEQRCLWVTSRLFFELFDVLENSLNDPATVWRDDRKVTNGPASRQKPEKRG